MDKISTTATPGSFTHCVKDILWQPMLEMVATVAFTGAMQTTTQNINIIDNNEANAGAGRRWNLVSNPFPSYIKEIRQQRTY